MSDRSIEIQLTQIQKTMNKQGKYIEKLEKDVAILKKSYSKFYKIEKEK